MLTGQDEQVVKQLMEKLIWDHLLLADKNGYYSFEMYFEVVLWNTDDLFQTRSRVRFAGFTAFLYYFPRRLQTAIKQSLYSVRRSISYLESSV